MNKKIKELLKEAKAESFYAFADEQLTQSMEPKGALVVAEKDGPGKGPQPNGHCTELQKIDLRKFAELIVQECMNVYEAIDNGNAVEGSKDFPTALHRRFMEK